MAGSSSKKKKAHLTGKNRDWIGSLPDDLLVHILSFLSTEESVRTGVLSKRWKNIWMSVPTKIDLYEVLYEDEGGREVFMNVMEKQVALNNSNIKEFAIACNVLSEGSRIYRWISVAASSHNVRSIYLSLREFQEPFELPACLFTCESLVTLEIDMDHDLNLPSHICLSNLKELSLNNVFFANDNLPQQLFSSCPVLEKLIIWKCRWNAKAISLPSLKILSLGMIDFSNNHSTQKLFSGCPVLEELEIRGCRWENVEAVCLSSLKILRLQKVDFPNVHPMRQLFSSCPVLEDLYIHHCRWQNVQSVCILTPMLKSLEITDMNFDSDSDSDSEYGDSDSEDNDLYYGNDVADNKLDARGCQFFIFGENISSFSLTGELRHDYWFCDSPSLVKASLTSQKDDESSKSFWNSKLLRCLSTVKNLTLNTNVIKSLADVEEIISNPPVFTNLAYLVTLTEIDIGCRGFLNILRSSPYLETIKFEQWVTLEMFDEEDESIVDQVPQCFSTHLKTIIIRVFYGEKNEIDAIKFLLKSATQLESISIYTGYLCRGFRDQLLSLPKASSNCKMKFQ